MVFVFCFFCKLDEEGEITKPTHSNKLGVLYRLRGFFLWNINTSKETPYTYITYWYKSKFILGRKGKMAQKRVRGAFKFDGREVGEDQGWCLEDFRNGEYRGETVEDIWWKSEMAYLRMKILSKYLLAPLVKNKGSEDFGGTLDMHIRIRVRVSKEKIEGSGGDQTKLKKAEMSNSEGMIQIRGSWGLTSISNSINIRTMRNLLASWWVLME